jgi:hypothetical protein
MRIGIDGHLHYGYSEVIPNGARGTRFNRERRTAKNRYISSMIAFSVALGRIAATHLWSSGE